jgi:argininosuccinate lyase
MRVYIPVSLGELIDKITILHLKEARVQDSAQRAQISLELTELHGALRTLSFNDDSRLRGLREQLAWVNEKLWVVEDILREREAHQLFGIAFTEHARSIYKLNDQRAALKQQINELFGSDIHEVKIFPSY